MSDSISENLSLLFLPKSSDSSNELASSTNSMPPHSLPSYRRLSSELWLLIFRYLERNDLDNCEKCCLWWHEMIRHNGKYLPGREIDYIIFSSKRAFSMVLSSGNIIKMYCFEKYFTLSDMLRPINDPSFVTVRTFRRSPFRPKPSPGANQLRNFFDELRLLTNGRAGGADSFSNEESADGGDHGKFGGVDAIGLHFPHFLKKTSYKIFTPPTIFFMKLNTLLRNLDHVNFIVFQTFTLTDAFVERFVCHIEPRIITNEVRLIRFEPGKTHNRAVRFFFGAILGNKIVWSSLSP
ncbi:hypothetical protein niasHT_006726 [Heterodera trifolii]|uniref:F-box domain-containing protein n=1 Tax=Heterodera trifolii TaxID=157864 RepID=A0ABD2LWM0_9BILA